MTGQSHYQSNSRVIRKDTRCYFSEITHKLSHQLYYLTHNPSVKIVTLDLPYNQPSEPSGCKASHFDR